MNRSTGDTQLERLLETYSATRVFPDQDQVLTGLRAYIGQPRRQQRSYRSAAALLVAALLVVGTSAFAKEIAEAIKRIALPRIDATQQDELFSEHDGEEISTEIGFVGLPWEHDVGDLSNAEWVDVDTLEEAQSLVGFTLKEPGYLPEGYVFIRANLLRYETGGYDRSATLYYEKPRLWNQAIVIEERYLGPHGRIDVKTVENISEVKINGRDALIEGDGGALYYVWDGILYRISAEDVETEIKIAESIE